MSALARHIEYIRAQDAEAARAEADTAYAMGRLDGAIRAHANAVRLVAARRRRDLDVARRNRALLAAIGV